MKTRTTWLSGVVVALGLGFFTTGTLLAQTKTTIDVRTFEVLAVEGNRVVVRDQHGTNEYQVPDDLRITVDGRQIPAKELKPGMKGTATITTKTTVKPVTVTETRDAVVVKTTPSSVLVRGADGVQRRFTQAELDKRGIEIIKDGSVVRLRQLNPGDQLTGTIITTEPPAVEKDIDVKLAEAKMEPAPAKATPPAAPAATPAAAPAAAPTAPTTVASSTPAAPSTAPVKAAPAQESDSWLLWVAVFIALVVVAFVFMRKKS